MDCSVWHSVPLSLAFIACKNYLWKLQSSEKCRNWNSFSMAHLWENEMRDRGLAQCYDCEVKKHSHSAFGNPNAKANTKTDPIHRSRRYLSAADTFTVMLFSWTAGTAASMSSSISSQQAATSEIQRHRWSTTAKVKTESQLRISPASVHAAAGRSIGLFACFLWRQWQQTFYPIVH